MDGENGSKATYSALSFQFLLEEIIIEAVKTTARKSCRTLDVSTIKVAARAISPCDIQNATLITYQTAIALKLSHQWNKPVDEIAEHIALHISRMSNERSAISEAAMSAWTLPTFTTAMIRTLTVSVHSRGYVQCHLSVATFDLWLEAMQISVSLFPPKDFSHEGHSTNDDRSESPSSDIAQGKRIDPQCPQRAIANIPFAVFHAHARCCSILRLANTMGKIVLQPDSDYSDRGHSGPVQAILRPPWMIVYPEPCPWQVILSPQKRPREWAIAQPLLTQIISSLDQCVIASSEYSSPVSKKRDTQILKEIIALSAAIHRFDADVTFGKGDAEQYVPYLGLILIAQRLLNALLTDFLDSGNRCLDIPDAL